MREKTRYEQKIWVELGDFMEKKQRLSYRPSSTKYSIRLQDAKVEELREIYGELGITELINSLIDDRLQEGGFDTI